MCGALQRDLEVDNIVLPIAVMRNEDTSDHYVDKRYPAVANYYLLKLIEEELRSRGYRPKVGIMITTSFTFTEGIDWARRLEELGILCIECETSVIYALSTLCRMTAAVALIVNDHVIESGGPNKEEWEKVRRIYTDVAKALLTVFTKYARIAGNSSTL